MTKDLTKGKPFQTIFTFSIPIVCGNLFQLFYAFDASPAWEDITAQVAINRVYNFLNQSKTAEKWGVNVRFTIEKNEGYEGEVSISGFGGAYE